MSETSRYGQLEDAAVTQALSFGLVSTGPFKVVAKTVDPMSFQVSDFPALLIFWRGTSKQKSLAIAGNVHTTAVVRLGMMLIMTSSDTLQGDARLGASGVYQAMDRVRACFTGWVPGITGTYMCQFPALPQDETPVMVDAGRFGAVMNFDLTIKFQQGLG